MVSEKTLITKFFINILIEMILWTAGSLFMRLQLPPGIDFWFNLSLIGILALPCTYLAFIRTYLEQKRNKIEPLLISLMVFIILVNLATGIFISPPILEVGVLGVTSFVYHTTLWLGVPLLVALAMIMQMLHYIFSAKKTNPILAKQAMPFLIGAIILLLGNAAVGLSFFRGIPVDIMAGVINAALLLYMISKKRIFKLKPIVSKGICYGITAIVSFALGYYAMHPLKTFLATKLPMLEDFHEIIAISLATLTVLFLYGAIKRLMDIIFKEEESKSCESSGLYNRKNLYEILKREYERSVDDVMALMIINIDDFKLYNQRFGKKEGDIALENIGKILKNTVGYGGYTARTNEKEFAVVLPSYNSLKTKKLAENISNQIAEMNKDSEAYAYKALTVSIGICAMPFGANTVEELLHNADVAVYSVKQTGKNGIVVYEIKEPFNELSEGSSYTKAAELYSEYETTIKALTAAIDAKDHYTFTHSNNVAYYSEELGLAVGLRAEYIEVLKEAALLHDIGKIGIPEKVLNKPNKLTDEEFEIIKSHVQNSIGIIRHIPALDCVIPAVVGHHERWDGKGYPRRIKGEDIPLFARILCIADSFDAMISKRVYKEAISVNKALEIIKSEAGKQFDPNLATIFVEKINNGEIVPNYNSYITTNERLEA